MLDFPIVSRKPELHSSMRVIARTAWRKANAIFLMVLIQ